MDVKCPICGSENYDTFRHGVNLKTVTWNTTEWTDHKKTYLCLDCGVPYNDTDLESWSPSL